jgi:endonuclease III
MTSLAPFTKTGSIWGRPALTRTKAIRTVCKKLTRTYGSPRFGNPTDPLDDLIYVVLSNKTTPATARRIYERLRKRFRKWDEILATRGSVLRTILKPAGLSVVKSKHIRAALRSIKVAFGVCDLRPLRRLSAHAAQDYLIGLPGVSEKVAKCIMMYTLHHPVLPVDTHVHRISSRLGWTSRKRADQCHDELEALVPPRLRRNFHVACIAHGRAVCRPRNPRCDQCCVKQECEFFKMAR